MAVFMATMCRISNGMHNCKNDEEIAGKDSGNDETNRMKINQLTVRVRMLYRTSKV